MAGGARNFAEARKATVVTLVTYRLRPVAGARSLPGPLLVPHLAVLDCDQRLPQCFEARSAPGPAAGRREAACSTYRLDSARS